MRDRCSDVSCSRGVITCSLVLFFFLLLLRHRRRFIPARIVPRPDKMEEEEEETPRPPLRLGAWPCATASSLFLQESDGHIVKRAFPENCFGIFLFLSSIYVFHSLKLQSISILNYIIYAMLCHYARPVKTNCASQRFLVKALL